MRWDDLLQLSRRHRVQGLVWHALHGLAIAMPEATERALADDAAAVAEHNLRAAHQSALLLGAFTVAGIPVLFIKGLTLSKLAYGDPFLKMSRDVDVLVPGEAIPAAAAQLQGLGYRLVTPAVKSDSARFRRWHGKRKESVWRSPDGLHLELHSRLADSAELIGGIGVGSPRREVEVAPGIVLPTLAPDELFAYLCVHGASSAWFRLKWITDLAALLHGCPPKEIERLYERSRQLGAGRAAAQALLLAAWVYGTAASSELKRKIGRTRAHRWLADAAWRQMVRRDEPTHSRFGTAMIHLTQLPLLPGVRFPLRELVRQIAAATP
ncbi:MAG: nucleotidyltransferase family protein [Sphingomicrobium sp.]